MADFLMKDEIKTRNVFTFLSQDSATGKYFCRSFFLKLTKTIPWDKRIGLCFTRRRLKNPSNRKLCYMTD
ncbi:MAG: hypothetical protein IJR39_01210 [Treponema sp.]|nr:hypothetical protein [Treponema sp.]